jgi:hypothetical protein
LAPSPPAPAVPETFVLEALTQMAACPPAPPPALDPLPDAVMSEAARAMSFPPPPPPPIHPVVLVPGADVVTVPPVIDAEPPVEPAEVATE